MFNTIRKLGLKFLSLRSLIVFLICAYYFVGMQIGTAETMQEGSFELYKIVFIVTILAVFITYFALHYKPIVRLMSTSSGIITGIVWAMLIVLTKQPSLIFILILVLTFYDKAFKQMTGYLFVWLSLFFISFSILSMVGLISTGEILKYNLLVDSSEYSQVTALGMGNPNSSMAYLLGIIMSGAYIFYGTKYKNKYGLLMVLVTFVVFGLVGSRTGLICALVFLILYLLDLKRITVLLRSTMPLIIISLLILSIFVGLRFGSSDNVVNDLLTTRPYQWGLRLEGGALTNIMGNSDTYVAIADNEERYPLDNYFIYLMARAGWLALLAVIIIYIAGNKRNESPVVAYMIFASLIQSFVESLMFTAIVNIGMLFILSSLLLVDKNKDNP